MMNIFVHFRIKIILIFLWALSKGGVIVQRLLKVCKGLINILKHTEILEKEMLAIIYYHCLSVQLNKLCAINILYR